MKNKNSEKKDNLNKQGNKNELSNSFSLNKKQLNNSFSSQQKYSYAGKVNEKNNTIYICFSQKKYVYL